MGRHQGTQYTPATVVAVDLLCHDCLCDGLRDCLSGLAFGQLANDRASRLFEPRRSCARMLMLMPRTASRLSDRNRTLRKFARTPIFCIRTWRAARGFPGELHPVPWLGCGGRQGLSQSQRRRLAVGRHAGSDPHDAAAWHSLHRRSGYAPIPDAGFWRDGILTPEQINDVAEYVLKLSGQNFDAAAATRGNSICRELRGLPWRGR